MVFESNKMLHALVCICVLALIQISVNGAPMVPCYFIFGDSLADSGNNNPLSTLAKANYPPYGIDYPNHISTGRFTNGLTTADIIGQLLGFTHLIPPFTLAKGSTILNGVNYASASAGIRAETGLLLGANINLDGQLNNHRNIVSRITALLKSSKAANERLNKCIYYVGIGSNDYINNYFLPNSSTSKTLNPKQYAQALINQYSTRLMDLYKSGARKIALFGVGQIGCTPSALSQSKGQRCIKAMNDAARIFNRKLRSLVDQLNGRFRGPRFIFVDVFRIGSSYPISRGFKVSDDGCCRVNKFGLCERNIKPCPNRRDYAFWDAFHPTEATNQIMAKRSFTSNTSDTYPLDISRLAQLKAMSRIYGFGCSIIPTMLTVTLIFLL